MLDEILSQLENDPIDHLFDCQDKISYKELIQKAKRIQIGPTKDNWIAIPGDDSLSNLMIKILGAIIQQVNFVVISNSEIKDINLPVISEIQYSTDTQDIEAQKIGRSFFGIQTSGTSGTKKIIVHPINNLLHSAKQLVGVLDHAERNTWNLILPAYHIGGLSILFRAFVSKRPVNKMKKADLAHSKFKGIISLVSAQLPTLLENTQITPEEISIHLGGGRANSSLLEKCLKKGFNVYNSYGLSEYCSTFSIKRMSLGCNYLSSGTPLSKSTFQIKEKKLFISGPNLFTGKLKITTKEAIIENAETNNNGPNGPTFFLTSDLAEESNGEILILGRGDEVIVSGGKNISMNLIKKKLDIMLKRFPLFSNYYLVTYPHEKWGETYGLLFDTNEREIPPTLRIQIKEQLNQELKPNIIHHFNSLHDIKGIKPTKDELLDIIKNINY